MPSFIMSFDTEDYIDPAADDITRTLCEILERHGIRGSFCMVAERARQLVARGRTDVIDALKRHEIAFHSTWHSRHPNPAEYMDPLSWDDGVAEHFRREKEGVRLVKEIFGVDRLGAAVPPGSSWAPQGIYAYAAMGIPIFAGSSISRRSGEPVWFVNSIQVPYNRYLDPLCHAGDVDAMRKVLDEHRSDEMLITCNHPTILRHSEFVDALNFGRGKNPPPQQWRQAPLRSEAEMKTILGSFEEWCRMLAADGDYRQTSYAEVFERYAQHATRLSSKEVDALAASVGQRPDEFVSGGSTLSPAEVFGLFSMRLAHPQAKPLAVRRLLGPVAEAKPMESALRVTADVMATAARQLESQMRGRMPEGVDVAGTAVPPAAFFVAMARAIRDGAGEIVIDPATPGLAAAERPVFANIKFRWACFAEDFTGEGLKRLARLQAWTYKSASAN